jgi:hypothetical protein
MPIRFVPKSNTGRIALAVTTAVVAFAWAVFWNFPQWLAAVVDLAGRPNAPKYFKWLADTGMAVSSMTPPTVSNIVQWVVPIVAFVVVAFIGYQAVSDYRHKPAPIQRRFLQVDAPAYLANAELFTMGTFEGQVLPAGRMMIDVTNRPEAQRGDIYDVVLGVFSRPPTAAPLIPSSPYDAEIGRERAESSTGTMRAEANALAAAAEAQLRYLDSIKPRLEMLGNESEMDDRPIYCKVLWDPSNRQGRSIVIRITNSGAAVPGLVARLFFDERVVISNAYWLDEQCNAIQLGNHQTKRLVIAFNPQFPSVNEKCVTLQDDRDCRQRYSQYEAGKRIETRRIPPETQICRVQLLAANYEREFVFQMDMSPEGHCLKCVLVKP